MSSILEPGFIREKYLEQKSRLIKNNERTRKIIPVNNYLKRFNWSFVHPYLLGGEVDQLTELSLSDSGSKETVFGFFAKAFFDLRSTAVYIDGYFKKRPSLAPFCQLIDQSVFMCLQRDYAGAINVLIPIIEGSIRHYLVEQKGKKNESIMRSSDLLKVFTHLKTDYLALQTDFYRNKYERCFGFGIKFNDGQIVELLKHESEFIDIWFSIIKDYFKNNLYLDTRTGNVQDVLNRHTILHGFNSGVYYTIENYIKIFNCVNFMSYAFGLADPQIHALTDISTNDIVYKWKAFEKIRTISNLTTEIKSSVYEKYADFDKEKFEEKVILDDIEKVIGKAPAFGIERRLKFIDYAIRIED